MKLIPKNKQVVQHIKQVDENLQMPKYKESGGGLSRKDDYKSDKKSYPSVNKKDFAGSNRSYPIPTKKDAVDALRLAGLHNRPDVKSKVYKKYPELKKHQSGGTINFDISHILNQWKN